MPREGVPYPERLLCSVRCELKNIWTALSGKLHSVNGVEGDGQGNVNIVSGDAAVVVTTDPSLNQIEVSLDQSQLPAAAVTSVNSQTGAVVLDGTDIKTAVYGPNNNAIQDIGTARTAIQTANQNINAEATARQNADTALQTNINNVTASLPGAAAAAVAADPTIASLVSADSQNVKLSGNQSIGGIKTVSTETTGTYSSQIANSNKIKNEIDDFAQYCILTTGNQSKAGTLQFQSAFSRGCTSADMIVNPTAAVGATIMTFIDQMYANTHNSLGSMTKVRNAAGQNYLDLTNISYGYNDGVDQWRIDVFIRLLIDDSNGQARCILYRQKRKADGSGTTQTAARVLADINFSE